MGPKPPSSQSVPSFQAASRSPRASRRVARQGEGVSAVFGGEIIECLHLKRTTERMQKWSQRIGTDPPARAVLGPQSADGSVMYSKRPGDICQRFPRLSSGDRFALLMSVKLEGPSHMDASGFRANAALASPHTN